MADILDWNYNSHTGAVQQLPSVQSAVIRSMGLGWHGPFQSKEDALAFYTANKDANPGWKAPAGWQDNLKNAAKIPSEAVGSAVTDQLGQLNLGAWFIRIGEVVLGIVLIGVGLAKLTGTTNAISKIAKVAIPG